MPSRSEHSCFPLRDTIQRYLDQHKLTLHNVLVDARLQAGSALGQRALPTTLFFDGRGQLAGTRIGELSAATLAERLSALRAGTPQSDPLPPH